jgi:hypothetical protein
MNFINSISYKGRFKCSNGTQRKEIPLVQCLLAQASHAKLFHWLDVRKKFKIFLQASFIRVEKTQNVNTDEH